MSEAYLADSCAVIVFLADQPMSPRMRAIMQEADVAVSAITVWEITRKAALGKLPASWGADGLAVLLHRQGFRPLPLTWRDAERANRLPALHRDPMDRMLIAQALHHDMPVITSDRIFEDYGVSTIW